MKNKFLLRLKSVLMLPMLFLLLMAMSMVGWHKLCLLTRLTICLMKR